MEQVLNNLIVNAKRNVRTGWNSIFPFLLPDKNQFMRKALITEK